MTIASNLVRRTPPLPAVALGVLGAYLVCACFAPLIAPHGETAIVGAPFEPWGRQFPLGTDNLGRDMLSRLIYSARNTIGLSLAITVLAYLVGCAIGLASAIKGGWVDQLLGRSVDALMAIPQLIFALLLLTVLGNSIPVLVAVIAAVESTRVFRLVRATAQGILVMDFMDSARLRGESFAWIALREILPNGGPPLLVDFGLRFSFTLLFISSLSFLGLGIQPPTASWGSMVRDTAILISYGDVTPLLPALALGILTVSVNIVVDWILDLTSGGA
jgi:peptide/nickel transport system permease protein